MALLTLQNIYNVQKDLPNNQLKSRAATSCPNLGTSKVLAIPSPYPWQSSLVELNYSGRLGTAWFSRAWPDCASWCSSLWESPTFETGSSANSESSLSTARDSLVRTGCHMLHWAGSGFGLYLSAICPSSWASFSSQFPTVPVQHIRQTQCSLLPLPVFQHSRLVRLPCSSSICFYPSLSIAF